jgi:penicillin-insensitive murein endopeptidase
MGILLGMMVFGWGDVLKPTVGSPEPIGFYSKGCIQGAATLPLDGAGFQVMRPSRNRFYGHPNTLQFIQKLGSALASQSSGILIGDISQPRGGPMTFGHASHQIGMDVDVWFWNHPEQSQRPLSTEERETLPLISMLNAKGTVDPTRFTAEQILKLKIAATSPEVERIFVNPAIKSHLCAITPPAESAWLRTLRPWEGHHAHFHVRLACPKDAKDCVSQTPPAAGNGCNEINTLSPSATQEHEQEHNQNDTSSVRAELPLRCKSVLEADHGMNIEKPNFKN